MSNKEKMSESSKEKQEGKEEKLGRRKKPKQTTHHQVRYQVAPKIEMTMGPTK
jgi:hypothetical protein